ncbi:MAG: biopolymer transporter ExbD [Bacteroidota bacterium]
MRVKRNKRFHAEIAASALSDIMFFLLLFFLIISTLANPNVMDVKLPKARSNATTDKAHISLSVVVAPGDNAIKQYYIDKQMVPFEQIETDLAEHAKVTGDNTVIVRLPFDLMVQDMVNILEIGERQKLKFVIATSK